MIVGLLRVFLFEKGGDYYLHNGFFPLKFALFVGLGLLSVVPTREFLSWRAPLRRAERPRPTAGHGADPAGAALELVGIVVILLCAR